ncbi:zinc-dependent alcohol dehydrogenase family protein [Pseudomonas gingeri]|uniref:zinc-dependent alcohol dehydrogenase family protein n=1 Tax=Pseudomonas gingeri TaxID=117681 RepID=UPI0015A1DC96|nr:zinc-dependent alcohol dehydrogenase family protein [Pseudomonas gingeri]NWA28551.1 zinc-dependent alcohol dehydrogenase family protein [Pseudomonas gingeri]NWD71179.1 zinc-dependent alcohol dehydrogenase family protein [Pseudomonas gingeri]
MSKVVRFHRMGGPEVLQIDEVDVRAPGMGEVRIKVKTLGLNRAEAMYRSGQYTFTPDMPAILGYEAAGTIESIGEDVTGYGVGDEVNVIPAFAFSEYGMYGELVVAPVHALVTQPAGLSSVEAAATWMKYVTAYGALVDIGNLQKGETVLIRAASSSVGLAAIQIANWLGAIPVALTRTSEKREALLEAGAAHVIATSEQDLVAEVNRITEGKGARMAFDPVGGPEVANILRSLTFLGIFFQYGALETSDMSIPVMEVLGKDLTIRGYQLFEITRDVDRLNRAKAFITEGLEKGALRPLIAKTFPFDQIVEAHRYMESNAQIGKIVIEI